MSDVLIELSENVLDFIQDYDPSLLNNPFEDDALEEVMNALVNDPAALLENLSAIIDCCDPVKDFELINKGITVYNDLKKWF